MVSIGEFRKAQRSEGPATILAIGTANPPNSVLQSSYADYYFRVTESEHKKDLKEKFRRMCDNSTIKKRYMVLTEEILKERPSFRAHQAPSLDEKQDISVVEIPKLGAKAATQAIKEWGQPMSKITHLVVCSTTGVDTPGADFQLVKLLGLSPSVKRMMLYQQGCFAGGSALRFAKDLAENNKGARVLIVASEITVALFHGPDEKYKDSLVGQAILGDGSAAIIVGSDPLPGVEKPIFELLSAAQTILPDSEIAIKGRLGETGLMFSLKKDIPPLIREHDIEKCLVEAFEPLGIHDWNSIFWCAHPGSRKILDAVKEKLSLNPTKLWASRKVLSDYGNMSSASVLFVLNEMRNYSATNGFETTGEGLEWGVLMSFGPGFTIETIVLHSVSI